MRDFSKCPDEELDTFINIMNDIRKACEETGTDFEEFIEEVNMFGEKNDD